MSPISHIYIKLNMRTSFQTIILVLILGVLAPSALAAKRPLTSYRAYAASSVSSDSCYGPVGVYASLDARFVKTQKLKLARKLQRSSKPTRASIRISSRRYALAIDTKTSGVDTKRLWWNFKRLKVSKAVAQRLIGKRLVLRYRLGKKWVNTRVTISPGDCGM